MMAKDNNIRKPKHTKFTWVNEHGQPVTTSIKPSKLKGKP